jgi:hypothetical protein
MSRTIAHIAKLIDLENEGRALGLRKLFQTRIEASERNPKGIDQVVDRKLLGVRGS